MNEIIVFVLDGLATYPFLIFCIIGFINGSLFRDIGLLKLIALIVIVPTSLALLIDVNRLWVATLPFLIFALLGYWGGEGIRYRSFILINWFRHLITRHL